MVNEPLAMSSVALLFVVRLATVSVVSSGT
jgi:hypothetical protein